MEARGQSSEHLPFTPFTGEEAAQKAQIADGQVSSYSTPLISKDSSDSSTTAESSNLSDEPVTWIGVDDGGDLGRPVFLSDEPAPTEASEANLIQKGAGLPSTPKSWRDEARLKGPAGRVVSDSPARKNSPLCDKPEADAVGDIGGIFVPSSRRQYESVAEAVWHAKEGDVITLQPGTYSEVNQILLDTKGVRVEAGAHGKVEIIMSPTVKAAPIVCSAEDVALVGLKLVRQGVVEKVEGGDPNKNNAVRACVLIESGNASVDRCTVMCQTGTGVYVMGESRPTIVNCTLTENVHAAIVCCGKTYTNLGGCTIKRNAGFGVWLLESADGNFAHNRIGRNSKCGVLCCGQCQGVFDSNKVSNGGQGGFWAQGSSTVVITNNVIRKNHRAAMQVSDDAAPIVASNTILEGEGGGIVVHDRAKGLFVLNDLSGSCRAGAGVMDKASPLFMCNMMANNNGGGAVVAGESSPSFIGNEFVGNGFVGVGMKENTKVLIHSNVIAGTDGYGVLMQGASKLDVFDSKIERNEQSGICVCDTSVLNAHGCTISAGEDQAVQKCGITLHGRSKIMIEDCTIAGNLAGNVLLNDHATCDMSRCQVSGSKSSGVTLQGASKAVLTRNIVSGNKICNLLVLDDSTLEGEWNTLSEALGCGVRIMGGPTCRFKHNTIMSNNEAGIVASGNGRLSMHLNRVSQNGKDGIHIEGLEGSEIVDNAIFENQASGLRLKNALDLKVTGNLIVASVEKPSTTALVLRGNVGGQLAGNFIHTRQGSVAAGHALQQVLDANIPCETPQAAHDAIATAMDSLAHYERKRDQHQVILNPDGSVAVASPVRKSAAAAEQTVESAAPGDSAPPLRGSVDKRRASMAGTADAPSTPVTALVPANPVARGGGATVPPRRSSMVPASPSSGSHAM
mmetsp:Transcript_44975/g.109742  ORF Transcript_44975/g.109742 Transcript_44975/m.109742 type:complete len:906 (-) Transcript_44975:226-2943(-)